MTESTVPHIPCLRLGKPYRSLNQSEVIDYRDGSVRATLSQVNAGVMRRDLKSVSIAREALQKFSTMELIEICRIAGDAFCIRHCHLGMMVFSNPQQIIWRHYPQPADCPTTWFVRTWKKFIMHCAI